MSAVRPITLVLGAALALAGGGGRAGEPADCRRIPYVSATCFSFGPRESCRPLPHDPCAWVSGRLVFENGTPPVRLRPAGSRRVLGVHGGDGDPASPSLLPANVDAASTPPQPGSRLDLVGRFRVCPLTTAHPGWMRPVCLAAAEDLRRAP